MYKKTFAKVIAWTAAGITILANNNFFGKYSGAILAVTSLLTALAAHVASDTSTGHPNG
jgi:hypothetical protein